MQTSKSIGKHNTPYCGTLNQKTSADQTKTNIFYWPEFSLNSDPLLCLAHTPIFNRSEGRQMPSLIFFFDKTRFFSSTEQDLCVYHFLGTGTAMPVMSVITLNLFFM